MRATTAAIFALLISLQPAGAGNFQDADGSWWTTIDPPKRYLDAPAGLIEVRFLSRKQTAAVCLMTTKKAGQFGCASLWPTGVCDITIAEDLPKPLRDAVHLHELAHCNGWSADHPAD